MEIDIIKTDTEKNIKYFPIYISIIYVIGFLVMSLRLGSIGLQLKDFFTLDYIKAGLLFIIYFLPVFRICLHANKNKANNFFIRLILSTIPSFLYCIVIGTFLHDNTSKESLIIHPWVYLPFIIFIYFITIKDENLKVKQNMLFKNLSELIPIILFSFIIVYNFSVEIYSEIKFEYGGGAPYYKTLVVKKNQNIDYETVKAKVYYENDDWIHYKKDTFIISLPKKYIIEQLTQTQ